MGNLLNKISKKESQTTIVMMGLDGVGKTTILYKLKKTFNFTHPGATPGFEAEVIRHKKEVFGVFDFSGSKRIRKFWKHYYNSIEKIHGLIFVVDSSDFARIDDAQSELQTLFGDHAFENVPTLILANKQDLKKVMGIEEIIKKLSLNKITNKQWYVQEASAINDHGLSEGMDWLAFAISKSNKLR